MTGIRDIVESIEASRANLRKVNPASSGHSAIVYITKRGSYVVAESRMTMGELWLGTPMEVYSVDLSPRGETYEMQLPSSEEAFFFSAEVLVVWQVADPIAAVQTRLAEPQHAIKLHLVHRLRSITRKYDVENSAAAELEINSEYGDREILVSEAVVIKRCSAVLTLDALASEHIAKRTIAEREQEALAMSRTTEQQAHQLELQRTEHLQELAAMKQRHELDMKQERMKVYADALRADDFNVLALRLADNNKDVNEVIAIIMEQRKVEFESAKAVLNELLEAKLLNHKHVAAIMANASNVVSDNLRGGTKLGVGSADAVRPAPLPVEAARAEEPDEDDDEPDD